MPGSAAGAAAAQLDACCLACGCLSALPVSPFPSPPAPHTFRCTCPQVEAALVALRELSKELLQRGLVSTVLGGWCVLLAVRLCVPMPLLWRARMRYVARSSAPSPQPPPPPILPTPATSGAAGWLIGCTRRVMRTMWR